MNLERAARAAGLESLAACAKMAGSKWLGRIVVRAGCRSTGGMRPIHLEFASPGSNTAFLNLARVATSYLHDRTKIYQQFISFA